MGKIIFFFCPNQPVTPFGIQREKMPKQTDAYSIDLKKQPELPQQGTGPLCDVRNRTARASRSDTRTAVHST